MLLLLLVFQLITLAVLLSLLLCFSQDVDQSVAFGLNTGVRFMQASIGLKHATYCRI